jgi:hypothetical protein
MNQALKRLEFDLQEVTRKENEIHTSGIKGYSCVDVRPYTPSDAIKKYQDEQIEYSQQVKNIFFGEIR